MEGALRSPALSVIEERLGYTFQNDRLLLTALTHSSYANENRETAKEDNERLEFLGDAILGALIGDMLYKRYPDAREKKLTRFRDQLVCGENLSRIADRIGVGDLLRRGNKVEISSHLLANAMEALIAAVYLDAAPSGMEKVKDVILPLFAGELSTLSDGGDPKSLLKQIVEQDGNESLDYRIVSVTGPAHDRLYEVEAYLNSSNVIGKGRGRSKKEAEQMAAEEALTLFPKTRTDKT